MSKLLIVLSLLVTVSAQASLFGINASGDDAYKHLEALAKIGEENSNTRSAGSPGHIMSANYIAQQLLAAGYLVELVPFTFAKYFQIEEPEMSSTVDGVTTPHTFNEDFNILTPSPGGNITATTMAIDLALGEGNESTSGCEPEDFKDFEAGKIAVLQRGACSFKTKADNAQNAGASGVVIFNQGNSESRKEPFNGSLGSAKTVEEQTLKIPVFSASYDKGVMFSENPNLELTLNNNAENKTVTTYNVIAETPGGRADNVVMMGSHLDSVDAGPGLNDNGSGSAGILEVAIKMMDVLDHEKNDYNKLRFAWWSAEEVGLIGSSRYVEALSDDEKTDIALYLNFDMIASPNYMIGVYDGDGSTFGDKGPEGSGAIERLFEMHFSFMGVGSVPTNLSGRSDYAPFAEVGIPFGGLFTGAEGIMTESEAKLFGGEAGKAYDECYHKFCDNLSNINKEALQKNVEAIGFVTLNYAYSTDEVNGNKFSRSLSRLKPDDQIRFEATGSSHCDEVVDYL